MNTYNITVTSSYDGRPLHTPSVVGRGGLSWAEAVAEFQRRNSDAAQEPRMLHWGPLVYGVVQA